jgi:hypothetical protein
MLKTPSCVVERIAIGSPRNGLPIRGRRIYGEGDPRAAHPTMGSVDRLCGKRLKSPLPVLMNAMERHGRLELNLGVRAGVLAPSAATIDRALAPCREGVGRGGVGVRRDPPACGGRFRFGRSPTGPRSGARFCGHAPGRRMASGNMRELVVCVAVHCLKHPRRDRR